MDVDSLTDYLAARDRAADYYVEQTLRTSPATRTEIVRRSQRDSGESPRYVRKTFADGSGLGQTYRTLADAWACGFRDPHLPHVLEVFDDGQSLTVLTNYIPGVDLGRRLAQRGPSVADAIGLFPQLCDAVIALHEGFDPPIIHRDIKPSNIIVHGDAGELVSLIDFGIARTFKSDAAQDTTQFGTREYAPPEQFGFGQTDVRTDVYALGRVLVAMLCGTTPAPQDAPRALAQAGAGPALTAVALRACAFDPAQRFQTARELKGAFLEAIGAGSSAVGRSYLVTDDPPPATRSYLVTDSPPATRSYLVTDPEISGPSASEIIGLIWDGLLVATWGLLMFAAVFNVFVPSPENIGTPVWYRVMAFIGFFATGVSGIVYGLLDKRYLRRRIPAMRRQTFVRGLVVTGVFLLVAFVFMTICVKLNLTLFSG